MTTVIKFLSSLRRFLTVAGASTLMGGFVLFVFVFRWRRYNARKRHELLLRIHNDKLTSNARKIVLGFFHPYCSGGGGGERVLWKMIQDIGILHERGFSVQIVIYTVDVPTSSYKQQILQQVQDRFDLQLSSQLQIDFVHLHEHAHCLQPAPRLSLLMESYGTMRLAAAAFDWHVQQLQQSSSSSTILPLPDWFIDTTGCAFTFLVARLLYQCRIMAYVHYPTISTDMLQLVWERRRSYNHSMSDSRIQTMVKLVYYCLFAVLYGITGSLAEVVLVNSNWTRAHIQSLWKWSHWKQRIRLVYPPCRMQQPEQRKQQQKRELVIVSIGQFRPEKDHKLQIESFHFLLQRYPEWKGRVKLIIIGSCRGSQDEGRLSVLRDFVQQLGFALDDDRSIEFVVNQPCSVLQQWLARASVGIHTMWNEHFGIGIVEMMDAGLIVVAHNSGGPKTDIISPGTNGYLAFTAEEYADALHQALSVDGDNVIRRKAIESSARFSDQEFSKTFQHVILSAKLLHP